MGETEHTLARLDRAWTHTPRFRNGSENHTDSVGDCWAPRDGSAGSCHFRGGHAQKI